MSELCVVPARANSKRLPGKNSKKLGDKPLIFHTIDKAIKSFKYVLFSSDDSSFLQMVKNEYGEDIITELRSKKLSSDTSKVIETVIQAHKNFSYLRCDSIWLSLPTCPFKTAEDFSVCKQKLDQGEFDYVVSITDCDFPPSLSLNRNKEGGIESTCPSSPWELGHSRSQDHRKCYRPNGAIYGARWDTFDGNWYFGNRRTYGHYMEPERSVDIDTELDFKFAEFLLSGK